MRSGFDRTRSAASSAADRSDDGFLALDDDSGTLNPTSLRSSSDKAVVVIAGARDGAQHSTRAILGAGWAAVGAKANSKLEGPAAKRTSRPVPFVQPRRSEAVLEVTSAFGARCNNPTTEACHRIPRSQESSRRRYWHKPPLMS